MSRRVQLVSFFTPSVFSVSLQFFFLFTFCCYKSYQISGQRQVVGEIPGDLRIAASCFSTTHILIPLYLCDTFSVKKKLCSGWLACCYSFQLKRKELSGSFILLQLLSFSIIPDPLVLKDASCLKSSDN